MSSPIRVAIVGVGNCAASLIQAVHYYQDASHDQAGLMRSHIGGYTVRDIHFVLGFDVDDRKVGLPLTAAIYKKPNCVWPIVSESELRSSPVSTGTVFLAPVLDGVAPHMCGHSELPNVTVSEDERFKVNPEWYKQTHLSKMSPLNDSFIQELRKDFLKLLKDQRVDVLLNYLPVGSQKATEFWAELCIDAKVNMVNCIPVFIASNAIWSDRFHDAGISIIGDDMRSQFGASILSQMLQELALARGHKVKAHIQQNVGGNTDFLNMKDETRLSSKKLSKENVLRSPAELAGQSNDGSFLFAGPSDYIGFYKDNKVATFRLELEGLGGSPVTLDARLSVQDSPNSAGVVLDAIRYVKVAQEIGRYGALKGPSAFTQKTPPVPMPFAKAVESCEKLSHRNAKFDESC